MIIRSAYRSNVPLTKDSVVDELAEVFEKEGIKKRDEM